MKCSEDGRFLIVRLSEQDGARGVFRAGQPVTVMNLLEDPERTVEEIPYSPFEILTFGIPLTQA